MENTEELKPPKKKSSIMFLLLSFSVLIYLSYFNYAVCFGEIKNTDYEKKWKLKKKKGGCVNKQEVEISLVKKIDIFIKCLITYSINICTLSICTICCVG